MSLSISSTLKKGSPKNKDLPFLKIANTVLAKNYDLSLVFIGDKYSRTLNRKYRKKDKVANILSFPISPDNGEIFINTNQAIKDAKKFNMQKNKFLIYLFIHGLLHLKGLSHGSKMERKEKEILKKFKI